MNEQAMEGILNKMISLSEWKLKSHSQQTLSTFSCLILEGGKLCFDFIHSQIFKILFKFELVFKVADFIYIATPN